MTLVLVLLYVLFAAGIGYLIWQQERRRDRSAEILGVTTGRQTAGIVAIVIFSAILSIVPTVIAWALLRPLT